VPRRAQRAVTAPSRTSRSVLNAGASVGSQLILIGLSFVTRTIFLAEIGTELLGVQTLFVSVLAVLAVADLGLSGALMYALYGPLHAGDHFTVSAIVAHAARLYRWVALTVALIGLSITPFLGYLVKLDSPLPMLQLYFLVMLADVTAAFLMVHRTILLTADQRLYLVKAYAVGFAVARTAGQITALVVFQSFLAFLVIQVLFTTANNAFIYRKAGRIYPYLSSANQLPSEERSSILRSVKAMLIYRVGGVVLNNSDPIIVSILLGTATLGYFANYMLLVGSAAMLLEAAFLAFAPGVGQLVASGDMTQPRRVLRELNFLASTVYGYAALAVTLGLNQFIEIWIGPAYLLSPWVVAALALNLYIVGTMTPIWAFRAATGMFRETQYVFVVTAMLNIALSVLFAQFWGVAGVLLATALARVSTGSWYEPRVLLKRHLEGSFEHFAWTYLRNSAFWLVLCGIAVILLHRPGQLTDLGASMGLLILAPIALWAIHRNSEEWIGLKGRALSILERLRS
jgi:O-antigen/teichoic acid export membrane protein